MTVHEGIRIARRQKGGLPGSAGHRGWRETTNEYSPEKCMEHSFVVSLHPRQPPKAAGHPSALMSLMPIMVKNHFVVRGHTHG